MSVHYKFKSALEYDTVAFDGLHISVRDLKNSIIQQKRIGKNTDFDLQVTNAQTKEVYEDEEALIPKNTSLLIARIPTIPSSKSKSWEGYGNENAGIARTDEAGPIAKAVDLSSLDASEDDKIRAMISQSTQDYDPSNYMKIRGSNQVGAVPNNYRCYKCHQSGHWIKDCPLSQGPEPMEIKKSTGIPRSFMVPVEGPQVQGAMMTPNGSYAVPVLDHQTYTQKQQPAPLPAKEELPEIPEDLICSICSGLLTDAVMIPCCGNSFCDECIRSSLLESEDHECPDCHERDISPGTLIPNRYLRNSVATFKNTTGYIKQPRFREQKVSQEFKKIEKKEEDVKPVDIPLDEKENKDKSGEFEKVDNISEKTVISEADSTEHAKKDESKVGEIIELKKESPGKATPPEGPPGVSPRRERSPRRSAPLKRSYTGHLDRNHNNGRNTRRDSRDMSPRRHNSRRSPHYDNPLSRTEERAGTPTVDEPGSMVSNSGNYPNNPPYQSGPPHAVLPPMMGMPPPHMQGPPPNYQGNPPPGVFPNQGPPPNFRLPPPGANVPAPYMGPYNAPPRPLFDPIRSQLQGPPPTFGTYPARSRNRDYGPSRIRTRTPPGIIDDPLEAFNRMLREKDERERKAKQRKGRSYSRSSSRSYSRSPKRRSRSPRRRNSRSRSRSFSMSRSRSRSFSPNSRNSPYREYSPRNLSPRRRPPSRYRSPVRSPPRYRYKDAPVVDRNRDREYDRHLPRERERYSRDRDFNYFDRDRGRWQGNMRPQLQDNFYPQEPVHSMQHGPPPVNRFSREGYAPYKAEIPPLMPSHIPPRRYDDIAPPGTDQPPIPGEEERYEDKYFEQNKNYDERERQERDKPDRNERPDKDRQDRERHRDVREKDERKREDDKSKKYDGRSRSPKKSPGRSKDRYESPDKKRRKHETPEKDDKHKRDDHRRDDKHKKETSDDERSKKNKDKKKKREKRDSDKKKRREKRDRHEKKRDEKEKKKDRKDEEVGDENKDKNHKEKENKEKEAKKFDTSGEDIKGRRSTSKEIMDEKHNHDKEDKKIIKDKKDDKDDKKADKEEMRSSEKPINSENIKHKDDQFEEIEGTVRETEKGLKELKHFKHNDKYLKDKPEIDQSFEYERKFEDRNLADGKFEEAEKKPEELKFDMKHREYKIIDRSIRESKPGAFDLYGDFLSEGVDTKVVENYGKLHAIDEPKTPELKTNEDGMEDGEYPVESETSKDDDVLDIHANEAELKTELDKEVLAPLPEKSKWEIDDDASPTIEAKYDGKQDRTKVTNEVLKRAENAIFAKAINAIRPIEIKKIRSDRAKLYSDQKEDFSLRNVTITSEEPRPVSSEIKVDSEIQKPQRLSVKERLGVKVDDLDRIVKLSYDRNRSRSLSPLSKRARDEKINLRFDDRRPEERRNERSRFERHARSFRNEELHRRDDPYRKEEPRREERKDDRRITKREEPKLDRLKNIREEPKRKRSRSTSAAKEHRHRRKEKKQKRDKSKKRKHEKDDKKEEPKAESKPKVVEKRKPTLDEANFEPDYDLDTESEKEQKADEKKDSSSSDSSDSSSEDDKRKRKQRKNKKKRSRRESTSSSSSSDSDSSEEEKERKRKKHKKQKKKKKKSKHK